MSFETDKTMIRARTAAVLSTLGIALILSTSHAWAAEWHVNGAVLPAGEVREITEVAKIVGGKPILEFEIGAINFKLACGKLHVKKGFITGPSGSAPEFLNFEECRVSSPAGCSIAGTEISTKILTGSTAVVGTEDVMTLKPKDLTGGSEIIMEITTRGTCNLNGCVAKITAIGPLELKLPNGKKENNDQRLEATASKSLTTGLAGTQYSFAGEIELVPVPPKIEEPFSYF